jgi:hypothetical protein
MKKSEFKYCSRPGFQMTFENGWTVSVQWHAHAYCSGKGDESPNAEIAAWDSEGEWYNFGSDTVLGYQTPDEVVTFMENVKNFSKTK